MIKLLELKNKAIEAKKAFNEFDQTLSEWGNILGCSNKLNKIQGLGVSEESTAFFKNLANVSGTIDRSYAELSVRNDELMLEYALARLGGKLGDIIHFIDGHGEKRVLMVESAHWFGEQVVIHGARVLKSGCKGKSMASVNLELNKWCLNKPFNIKQ